MVETIRETFFEDGDAAELPDPQPGQDPVTEVNLAATFPPVVSLDTEDTVPLKVATRQPDDQPGATVGPVSSDKERGETSPGESAPLAGAGDSGQKPPTDGPGETAEDPDGGDESGGPRIVSELARIVAAHGSEIAEVEPPTDDQREAFHEQIRALAGGHQMSEAKDYTAEYEREDEGLTVVVSSTRQIIGETDPTIVQTTRVDIGYDAQDDAADAPEAVPPLTTYTFTRIDGVPSVAKLVTEEYDGPAAITWPGAAELAEVSDVLSKLTPREEEIPPPSAENLAVLQSIVYAGDFERKDEERELFAEATTTAPAPAGVGTREVGELYRVEVEGIKQGVQSFAATLGLDVSARFPDQDHVHVHRGLVLGKRSPFTEGFTDPLTGHMHVLEGSQHKTPGALSHEMLHETSYRMYVSADAEATIATFVQDGGGAPGDILQTGYGVVTINSYWGKGLNEALIEITNLEIMRDHWSDHRELAETDTSAHIPGYFDATCLLSEAIQQTPMPEATLKMLQYGMFTGETKQGLDMLAAGIGPERVSLLMGMDPSNPVSVGLVTAILGFDHKIPRNSPPLGRYDPIAWLPRRGR